MLTKLNKGLLGLFGVQLVLAVIVLSTRGVETVSYKQEVVLAGFDAATVTRLQIFADGGTKPAIDLVQNGKTWSLASHFNYPADAAKVTAALAPLGKMAAGEPVATSASRHKQLKVADTVFDKKLVITAGGKDTTVYIGAGAGLRRTAVRRGSEEIVLGAAGVTAASIPSAARDWVAKTYSEIPRDDIEKIVIQRGTASIELDRSEHAAAGGSGAGSSSSAGPGSGAGAPPPSWRLAFDGAPLVLATGEKLDDFAINTVLSEVASIDASPADPAKDASKPTATVTATRKGGTAIVFDLVADGDQLWIKQRGSDRATQVDKLRLEAVVKAERSTLVAKPDPAPAAGSGSGSGGPSVFKPIVPKPPLKPAPKQP